MKENDQKTSNRGIAITNKINKRNQDYKHPQYTDSSSFIQIKSQSKNHIQRVIDSEPLKSKKSMFIEQEQPLINEVPELLETKRFTETFLQSIGQGYKRDHKQTQSEIKVKHSPSVIQVQSPLKIRQASVFSDIMQQDLSEYAENINKHLASPDRQFKKF